MTLKRETKASQQAVWQAWQTAYQMHTEGALTPGMKGKTQKEGAKGFRYQILDVKEGESFSILWKSLFARLIFTHKVTPTKRGAEIEYSFRIRGPFAFPLRWLLQKKIHKSLSLVLQAFVQEVEKKPL